jgi:hypothetical protein
MTLQITDNAKGLALSYLVGKDTTVEDVVLKLYSNDYTPDEDSASTDFVELTSGNGYSSQTLTGASWIVNGKSVSYPTHKWTFTASKGNIYGYYVVTSTSNVVLFSERFPSAPYNVANNGDNISVTLNLTSN